MPEPADSPTTKSAARDEALSRIKKRRDFVTHIVTFVVVNLAFWALWAVTGAGYVWPAWITGLWGIGLIMNAWDVYFRQPISEADIEAEMRRSGGKD